MCSTSVCGCLCGQNPAHTFTQKIQQNCTAGLHHCLQRKELLRNIILQFEQFGSPPRAAGAIKHGKYLAQSFKSNTHPKLVQTCAISFFSPSYRYICRDNISSLLFAFWFISAKVRRMELTLIGPLTGWIWTSLMPLNTK